METSSAWGAAPLFAAMFVLVVTVWSIALPALREDKDRASARWLALAALLSALASATVGIEAIADQSEAEAEAVSLSANQIIGVIAVLGSFFAVGLGLPRVLWKLSKPRDQAKPETD
ncbi:MAG: hypothetical protein AAFR82_02865 [Pseudomonadota bacterium]